MAVPNITSVLWYSKAQQVTVSGSGFGSRAAYVGNNDFIALHDNTTGGDEGHTGDGGFVLNVSSWTDTQIQFTWTPVSTFVAPLHTAKITVWDANAQNPSSITFTVPIN